jgi:hypothetical protein
MPSLFANGWKRGSVLSANLNASATIVVDGLLQEIHQQFGLWMVVTQDCELFDADESDGEPKIELRPLGRDASPPMLGIRSRKLRISHGRPEYLHSESLRCMISPAALTAILGQDLGSREEWLDDDELLALKTWLGLRYDRPAIPTELVDLAVAIAQAIERRKSHPALRDVRDVLAQFDTSMTPPQFRLFGLVLPSAAVEVVRELLLEAATSVSYELGVVSGIEIGTANQISIHVLETSFALDLTKITWRSGRPDGAV